MDTNKNKGKGNDDMFDDVWDVNKPEKLIYTVPVRYLIIDAADTENQGLYKESVSRFLKHNGIVIVMKEIPAIEDIALIEFPIGRNEARRTIRVSCGVEKIGKDKIEGFYEVELNFIVLKETDRVFIEDYLRDREQAT